MPRTANAAAHPSPQRRGIVLIAVLVVIAILSLAAYHYSDMMTAEYRVSVGFTRTAQVRAAAESGVNYCAAVLSSPDNLSNVLNGNPFNNPDAFQDQTVKVFNGTGTVSPQSRFSVVTPVDPNDPSTDGSLFRYGVADEGGKINVNTLMQADKKGTMLYNLLMKLPNMTDDIANSIVFWVDPAATPRSSGGDASYYAGLTPTYSPKNGPIDSLDELLLVKGVTPLLLYGYDKNRNGVIDDNEQQAGGDPTDRGWSAYLTLYSRELNLDAQGNPRIYINGPDLETLYTNLAQVVDADLAAFIVMYRLYGGVAALPKNSKTQPSNSVSSATLQLTGKKAANPIASLYDLVTVYVSVPGKTPKDQPTYYASPLQDSGRLKDLLPKLLDKTTTSLSKDVFGRINVNTAPQAVLLALPGLASTDVDKIMSTRPSPTATDPPDAIFQTPGWLLTEAKIGAPVMKNLEKYVTARSQVYRMQVIGYLDNGGPAARLDVAIDTNSGTPRVVYYRDLTELGKGFDLGQNKGQ